MKKNIFYACNLKKTIKFNIFMPATIKTHHDSTGIIY